MQTFEPINKVYRCQITLPDTKPKPLPTTPNPDIMPDELPEPDWIKREDEDDPLRINPLVDPKEIPAKNYFSSDKGAV